MAMKLSDEPRTTVLAPTCRTLAAWSRRELGLADSVERKAVGLHVLNRLQNEAWLPSPAVQFAFETLSQSDERLQGSALPRHGAGFFVAAEKHQRELVEQFAREFFQLPPDDRRARWATLLGDCAEFPRLVRRLRPLEAGLDVDLPNAADDRPLCDLAGHLGELFAATPARRVALRLNPSDRYSATKSEWSAAARRLKREFPQVAALDAKCLNDLSWGLSSRPVNLSSVGAEHSSQPLTSMRRTHYDYDTTPVEQPQNRRRSSAGKAGLGGLAFVILLVIRMVGGIMSSDHSRTSTSYPLQSAPYSSGINNNYQYQPSYHQGNPAFQVPAGGFKSPVNQPGVPSAPNRPRTSTSPPRPSAPSPGRPSLYGGRR